jgi:tetratricopeptide (TPR) repeat protein
MAGILGLLSFALFIALIVGLVKPSLILRWTNKPTRLKVIGYWFLSIIVTGILGVMFIDDTINAKANIESASKYIEEGKYSNAISELEKIQKTDTLYNNAQLLLKKADSLSNLTAEQKQIAKELKNENAKKEELLKQREQLEREIKSIDEGIKFADGNTIDALQMDIVVFGSWAKLIKDAEESEETEIQNLGKNLKSKVSRIQVREFPNLRKQYAKIVAKKMWENDIEVSANGTGKRYINFSGGVFAANKNKKEFQTQVQEVLNMFRFNQARYRWYKGESEYTYYTMYEGKDSEPVTFE